MHIHTQLTIWPRRVHKKGNSTIATPICKMGLSIVLIHQCVRELSLVLVYICVKREYCCDYVWFMDLHQEGQLFCWGHWFPIKTEYHHMTETVLKIELNNHNTDIERTRRVPLGEQELLVLPENSLFRWSSSCSIFKLSV